MTGTTLAEDFLKMSFDEKLAFLRKAEKEGRKDSIDLLIEILETETQTSIKEKVLLVLGSLLSASAYKSMERMLLSSDAFTRNGAIRILKGSQTHLFEHLRKLAQHQDKDVRKFAIDSLPEGNSDETIEILGERLSDREINVRITALEYLGNREASHFAEQIEDMLMHEQNLMLRCSALEALAKIGVSPRHQAIVKQLSREANDVLGFSLIKYLGAFGGKVEIATVIRLATECGGPAGKELIDAIEGIMDRNNIPELPREAELALNAIMNSTHNSAEKYEIIKILSKSGGGSAEIARAKIKAGDEMEVLSAVEILGNVGTAQDIEALEALADSTDDVEILEAVGDAVEKIRHKI